MYVQVMTFIHSFIHSFNQSINQSIYEIYIAPHQGNYSEVFQAQAKIKVLSS